jgi:hypothetical protein
MSFVLQNYQILFLVAIKKVTCFGPYKIIIMHAVLVICSTKTSYGRDVRYQILTQHRHVTYVVTFNHVHFLILLSMSMLCLVFVNVVHSLLLFLCFSYEHI